MGLQHRLAAPVDLQGFGPVAEPLMTLHEVIVKILGEIIHIQAPLITFDGLLPAAHSLPMLPQRLSGPEKLAAKPHPRRQDPGGIQVFFQERPFVQSQGLFSQPSTASATLAIRKTMGALRVVSAMDRMVGTKVPSLGRSPSQE